MNRVDEKWGKRRRLDRDHELRHFEGVRTPAEVLQETLLHKRTIGARDRSRKSHVKAKLIEDKGIAPGDEVRELPLGEQGQIAPLQLGLGRWKPKMIELRDDA